MALTPLNTVSPVDGRYHQQTRRLSKFFSEGALMRYRVFVEIEYFIALCEIPLPQLAAVSKRKFAVLRRLFTNLKDADIKKIKNIEKRTNHDIKAVEYFLRDKLHEAGLKKYLHFIHFGLTSQDINNTAMPMAVRDAVREVFIPEISGLLRKIKKSAGPWKRITMLARTHGQPASPTKAGKEMLVFAERLENQLRVLEAIPFPAKFSGATGNFNAHVAAYPAVGWKKFADRFVNKRLGLKRLQVTTQIEHYDAIAGLCDCMKRINNVLINLSRDMWLYISFGYFNQKINLKETGSSAMPHKINPIDFENAEGNLGVANALFEHFAAKLPVSRLQRDLTDSTVLRNIGVPFAHTLIALNSLKKGWDKLAVNESAIRNDLNNHWEIITEAIQVILKREGYADAYEQMKNIVRNNRAFTKKNISDLIDNLNIKNEIKKELKRITPFNYTGVY